MRNIRKILALLLALFLTAALCGCAASRMDDGLAGTSGSDSVKPADATDFMSYAGPIFPLTLAQAAPALSADREILLDCEPYAGSEAAVTVTDRYTIQNSSGEACTATVLMFSVTRLQTIQKKHLTVGTVLKQALRVPNLQAVRWTVSRLNFPLLCVPKRCRLRQVRLASIGTVRRALFQNSVKRLTS